MKTLEYFWNLKKDKYLELLSESETPIVSQSNALELVCREFVWWVAKNKEYIATDEIDTFGENLFSDDSQRNINAFFSNKINSIVNPPVANPASEKQIKYIEYLLSKNKNYGLLCNLNNISKKNAGDIIEFFLNKKETEFTKKSIRKRGVTK